MNLPSASARLLLIQQLSGAVPRSGGNAKLDFTDSYVQLRLAGKEAQSGGRPWPTGTKGIAPTRGPMAAANSLRERAGTNGNQFMAR